MKSAQEMLIKLENMNMANKIAIAAEAIDEIKSGLLSQEDNTIDNIKNTSEGLMEVQMFLESK